MANDANETNVKTLQIVSFISCLLLWIAMFFSYTIEDTVTYIAGAVVFILFLSLGLIFNLYMSKTNNVVIE